MNKYLKGTLLGLLFLVILALILAPGIARKYVVRNSPELIGRTVEIDRLRLGYLAGRLRITGFNIYEADGSTPFVAFDTLLVDLKPLRLLKRELYLQRFYLSGLSGVVIQEDSVFNFDDLVAFHAGSPDGESPEEDSVQKEAFKYHLYDITMTRADFRYDNRNIGDTLILDDLSFTIPYVGWDQDDKSEAGLRFNLERDGYLEAMINMNPVAGDFDMNLRLERLYLDRLTKLAGTYARIGALEGVLRTRIEVRGNFNTPEQSVVTGELELSELSVSDPAMQEILGMQSLRLVVREAEPSRKRFLVDSLILDRPYVYFELMDSTSNLAELLLISPADTAGTGDNGQPSDTLSLPEGAPDPLFYAVQSFRIGEGTVDFRDNTTGEPFDYHLSGLSVETDSILSSSDWVSIYADMILNDRGTLVAEAGFEPLHPSNFSLDYTITDFQLSDLNIYSRHYVGFPVLYGEMFYRGHTEVRNRQLVSDNHLIMDHVELGDKRGGLVDLPLKLALYILKDRNDVIDLEIPVRGRTDDPKVAVGQIVWNTLKNLIVRTATAPYDYLAGLLGVNPKDVSSIDFAYADTTLTDHRKRQLETLLELEALKPSLEIELVYYNDPERERQAILMTETGQDSATVASMDSLLVAPFNADSLVSLYETVRLNSLQDFLNQNSDSTLITVTRSNPRDPLNVGGMPRFEARYSMKDEELGHGTPSPGQKE